MDKAWEIIQGDALAVLKGLPDESIQCAITSPPYYGLRSYKTTPQIWDNHNGCVHEWGEFIRKGVTGGVDKSIAYQENQMIPDSTQAFCSSCNAWRGELGLEPTFQLYISHLIQIFAEVKRVLKSNGTCFVNLGDSFSGGKGQSGQAWSTNHLDRDTLQKAQHQIAGLGQTRPTDLKQTVRPKSLMNIPARFAIAMTENPYTLRSDLTEEQRTYAITELMKRGII